MADAPDIKARRKLDKLGARLEDLRRNEAATMRDIAAVAAEALEAGLKKAEIAERAGISRPTLDRLLPKK